jgi:hypothetical protein
MRNSGDVVTCTPVCRYALPQSRPIRPTTMGATILVAMLMLVWALLGFLLLC